MEDLPVPLSRVELYLAKACGMDVTVPEAPESRLEQYLAILAGDTSVEMPAPMSLTEQWLAYVLGVTPNPLLAVEGACYIGNQKVDVRYFAVAAGMPGAVLPPAPQNRKEQYFANLNVGPTGVLKYATGTTISLTDVVRGIEELQFVYGDTVQNGTPTPDAPVAVQTVTGEQSVWVHGKNLANPQTFIDWIDTTYDLCVQYSWGDEDTRPKYGAYQNRDHVARFSGSTLYSVRNSMANPTYEEAKIVYQNMGFKENTRYTISFDINSTGSGTATNLQFLYTDGTTSNISGASQNTWAHCAVKSQSGKTISCIRIIYLTGMVYLDLDTLQIEEGDATTYEPYQGATYPIDLVSKNLMNYSTYDVANGRVMNMPDLVLPIGTFTISFDLESFTLGTSDSIGILLYLVGENGDSSYDDGSGNKTIFTIDSSTQIGRYSYTFTTKAITHKNNTNFRIGATQYDKGARCKITNIQIEVGSTPTAYVSYFTPIELCKIGDYQDYIYKSGDEWYVHKEIYKKTFNGSESWVSWPGASDQNNTRAARLLSASISPSVINIDNTQMGVLVSDSFTDTIQGYLSSNDVEGIASTVSNIYIRINKTTIGGSGTVGDFMNWLTSNNVIVYYVLATATDTKITDNTLIGQLNAVGSAVLPKPNAYIEVSADSTNLPGSLKISYYGEEE